LLTEGSWWAFEDGREDSPLLSSERWNDLCLSNGFSGLKICCPDHNAPTKRTMMMVAEAVEVDSVRNDQSAKIKLLRGWDTPAVDELVSALIPSIANSINYSEVSWDGFKVQPDSVYVIVDTTEHPLLHDPTSEMFGRIHTLFTTSTKILWISLQESEGPYPEALKGLVRGFSRSLRRENLEQKLITIDVQNLWKDISSTDLINSLLQITTACFWPVSEAHRSNETEFGYLDGHIVIPRVQKDNKFFDWTNRVLGNNDKLEMTPYHQRSRPLHLKVEVPGILSSLRFVDDDTLQKPLLPHEIEVDTRAYGINFKDVFIALGQLAHRAVMVGEACGVVTRVGEDMVHRYKVGDRVAGINAEPFACQARLKGNLAYKLPDSISFEVGASIPAIYLTAWYCLVNNARLGPGQSVLIHAAAGGVGQAAIQLAQHLGATIFATVGSASKSQLLVETYGIPKAHIFSTRSRSFKAGVLRLTNGRGVDVVLNSLSGEMLSDSLDVVAQLGTFVEIGKSDIYKQSNLIMAPFDRGIKFVACDLVLLFDDEHSGTLYQYSHEIFKLFESGAFYAVAPINVFPVEKIEDAFRLIASRKHTGKVVLQCGEDAIVKATLPKPQALQLDRNGTYVIAGGLSDIGKRIAQFLAEKGAGHVVTLSRRTLENDVRADFEKKVKQAGATLHIIKCDILDEISVRNAVAYCSMLTPIRGVIHCGNVLRVSTLLNHGGTC
jgi:NADPH:quinone reductase-like Zn-dependent oxidoreductase